MLRGKKLSGTFGCLLPPNGFIRRNGLGAQSHGGTHRDLHHRWLLGDVKEICLKHLRGFGYRIVKDQGKFLQFERGNLR